MSEQEADGYVVSDPELITRVRSGDRQAFGELYRRHSPPATTLARQFARNSAEADDLVSESFARVLDNLLDGKGPDSAFRAYLFTTIRNTAYDRTRKDKRLQFTDDMTTHDAPVPGDDPVLMKMESGLVATAFAQLPERWQAVLWHTQVEGESPAQVGALLGMAPGAVSSLAFRAREGLREAYLQAHLAETAAEQCRSTVERLGAWTRGGLSKRETQQVDAHLKTCDRCRALAAELQEVNHNLRGLLAPLLLGGAAAAGYLATLGPVTPLAAPGALAGGAAGGSAGSAGGSSGGAGGAAAGAGGAGAGGGASAAGIAAAAAAAAAGAAALGLGALAGASQTAGAAGGGGAGAGGAGAGAGGAGAGAAAAPAAATAAAAGAGAAGAGGAGGAAAGLSGLLASVGTGGLVAAGAVLAAAVIAAVVFIVNGSNPEPSTTAAQPPAVAAPAAPDGSDGSGGAGGADGSGGTSPAGSAGDGSAGAGPGGVGAGGDAGTGTGTGIGGENTGGTSGDGTGGTGSTGGTGGTGGTGSTGGTGGTGGTGSTGGTGGTAGTGGTGGTGGNGSPTPANVSVTSDPQVVENLVAGGSATISATVANSGQQDSAPQTISVQTPPGVTVSGVGAGDPQALGLRRAAAAAVPITCSPANTCSAQFVIARRSSVDVTVTISASRAATGGDVALSMLGRTFTLPVTVQSAVTSLVGQPQGALIADGGTHVIAVTQTVANGAYEPITFTSTSQHVTFENRGSCATNAATVTCTPDQAGGFELAVGIARDQPPGVALPVEAADSAGREVTLTGSLSIQPAQPADLVLASAQIGHQPVAGGQGDLTVTVANRGGTASAGSLEFSLPDGIGLVGRTTQGVTCSAAGTCSFPPVDPQTSQQIGITISAGPTTTGGSLGVRIAGQETEETVDITVGPGITGLTASADQLVADGSTQPVTVTAKLAPTVTDPGPIIFRSNSDQVSVSCGNEERTADTATCVLDADNTVQLWVTISVGQKAGPLPITAGDALGRPIKSNFGDLKILAPATLTLVDPRVTQKLHAGGSGTFTVTVRNTGDLDSEPGQPIDVKLPDGMTLAGLTIPGGSCTQTPTAALAVAAPTAVVADSNCTLPAIPARSDLEVGVAVEAHPYATDGTAVVSLPGTHPGVSREVTLPVAAGISGLAADPETKLFADGVPRPLTLIATPAADGLDLGSVAVSSGTDTVKVTCADGGEPCPVGEGNAVLLTVAVSPKTPAGPLKLIAKDQGGRDIEVAPVSVVGAPHLSVSDLSMDVQPVQGGQGRFSLIVSNPDDTASPGGSPVTVSAPGLAIDRVEGADSCADPLKDCRLPAIAAGSSITLTITVSVPPTTKPGGYAVTVDLLGQSKSRDFTIIQAVRRVTAVPGGPYSAGTSPELTLTLDRIAGSTEPVTITATSDLVTLTGCGSAGRTVTCSDSSFPITLALDAKLPSGPLPVTVTDGAGGSVPLTDAAGNGLKVRIPLQLSDLTVVRTPYDEVAGILALTVTNHDLDRSATTEIGYHVTGRAAMVAIDGATFELCPVFGLTCRVPAIDPGGQRRLQFLVLVAPGTSSTVSVTIDGTTRTRTIGAPPTQTSHAEPTPTGEPATRGPSESSLTTAAPTAPATPTPVPDIPAPTTDTQAPAATSQATETPGPAASPPTTDMPTSSPSLSAMQTPTEPLPTEASEAPSTDEPSDSTTPEPSIEPSTEPSAQDGAPQTAADDTSRADPTAPSSPAAEPAHLIPGRPAVVQAPTAGGSGRLSLTVENHGGEPSTEQALQVTLPTGVTVASISVDGASAGASAQFCILPSIASGESVTVVVDLTVSDDAQDGPAVFNVGESATAELTIERPQPAPGHPSDRSAEQPAVRKDDAPSEEPAPTTVAMSTTGA